MFNKKITFHFILLSITLISSLVLASFFINTKLKLFVLGDSISMMYGKYLSTYLADEFIYARKGDNLSSFGAELFTSEANGEDSDLALSYYQRLLNETSFQADIILINAGLHDIKRTSASAATKTTEEAYERNFRAILNLCEANKTIPILINTTRVIDSIHNSTGVGFKRFNKDVLTRNKILKNLASEKDVFLIDIYEFTENLDTESKYSDHVHFTDQIRKLQAAYIAGFLNSYKHKF